jgi:hypothetical protein
MQPACIRCSSRLVCSLARRSSLTARQTRCSNTTLPALAQHFPPSTPFDLRQTRPYSHRRNVVSKQQKVRDSLKSRWQLITITTGLLVAGQFAWYSLKREEDGSGSRTAFRTYALFKKEPVSSTASVFYMRPTDLGNHIPIEEGLSQGIINLEFKQPQIQVVRAYTPLPHAERNAALRFFIRQEPNGEVSSWLHRLPLGYELEMRGPNYEFVMPQDTEKVVFLAGGTGIAPAIQAANCLLAQPRLNTAANVLSPSNGKQIHILWASRRREDCVGGVSDFQTTSFANRLWRAATGAKPSESNRAATSQQGLMVRELENLKVKYPGQVFVSYYVDEESTFITADTVRRSLEPVSGESSSITPSVSSGAATSPPSTHIPSTPQTQILVSGPDGFIAAIAGPKIWQKGQQEQGPLGGILAKVLLERKAKSGYGAESINVYKI